MYEQFDVVLLRTTKNVKYLSSPTNVVSDPRGHWSVVGFVENDVMLISGVTVIRIPISDIKLHAKYDPAGMLRRKKSGK